MKINKLTSLPGFSLDQDQLQWLDGGKDLHTKILTYIAAAQCRIYLVALYLEDDEAGREVFQALIKAKKNIPKLDIKVFIDFHRAQRGRIGEKKSSGNAAMYRAALQQAKVEFDIYGIPVKKKEVFGVLHLKGFIFDDTVLYTGASLNNVYLHYNDKYRLDRYHVIRQAELANSMSDYVNEVLVCEPSLQSLLVEDKRPKKVMNRFVTRFKRRLSRQHYDPGFAQYGTRITPLVGLGSRANQLNKVIIELIRSSESHIFMCTPYFNLPSRIRRALGAKLRSGCKIELVVGDKTSSDFYIQPEEKFNLIGVIPYLYEQSLRSFIKSFQWAIDEGRLTVYIWKDGKNSYHVKGISADDNTHLLTGNNLNPRAWSLDLENGLLIQDPKKIWKSSFTKEKKTILQNTSEISHYSKLESKEHYPQDAKKVLKRLNRFKIEKLIQRLL